MNLVQISAYACIDSTSLSLKLIKLWFSKKKILKWNLAKNNQDKQKSVHMIMMENLKIKIDHQYLFIVILFLIVVVKETMNESISIAAAKIK